MYGKQLNIPKFTKNEILEELQPILEYYPERDRGFIAYRAVACITGRQ